MRRPAGPAPRPPRRHLLIRPVQLTDQARDRVPPPPEHPAARRARQLPVPQLPLDCNPVTIYREHDASERQPAAFPGCFAKRLTGKAAPVSDVNTVPSHTKKDNPKGCSHHIRNVSDANLRLHRHPE
jgi:hypothetical protein